MTSGSENGGSSGLCSCEDWEMIWGGGGGGPRSWWLW